MWKLIGFVGGVLALAAVGCSSNNNTYSCTFGPSNGVCYQWTTANALNSAQVSQLEAACTGSSDAGTFVSGGSCSSSNRVGSCTFTFSLAGVTYEWVFYSPGFTAAAGQTECTNLNGSWTAG